MGNRKDESTVNVLTAVVRALLPEEVLQHRPAEVVASRVWQIIQVNPNGTLRSEFEQLLALLNTRIGMLLLTGKAKPFQHHSTKQAETILMSMANSRVTLARRAFQSLKRLRYSAVFIAIARDCGAGRVKLGRDGEPVLEYRVNKKTAHHLLQGIAVLMQLHASAGAVDFKTLHQFSPSREQKALKLLARGSFDTYARYLGYAINRLPLYSAHQMGTCRASGDRARGVTDPTGKVWGTQNLYIADASLFPTALGVNPMLTVMAIAKWVAKHIL